MCRILYPSRRCARLEKLGRAGSIPFARSIPSTPFPVKDVRGAAAKNGLLPEIGVKEIPLDPRVFGCMVGSVERS
jgi:hypothetical protein